MTFERLSASQRALLDEWMPASVVVADLSWSNGATIVLRVRQGGADFVVKAAGDRDHHLGREVDAHAGGFVKVWADAGHAARLRHSARDARLLVTEWLPGELADRTSAAVDPEVHRSAGALLRKFHAQASRASAGADAEATRRALAWLDSPHAIAEDVEVRLRAALTAFPPREVDLVPTHGDWHPRNWLVDNGVVRVIDFGRFAFRQAATDFARLAAQEWCENPDCEAAFFDGYGDDPREPSHWRLIQLREAIGTAVWAHQVGDQDFEAQGHRMITEALAGFAV